MRRKEINNNKKLITRSIAKAIYQCQKFKKSLTDLSVVAIILNFYYQFNQCFFLNAKFLDAVLLPCFWIFHKRELQCRKRFFVISRFLDL